MNAIHALYLRAVAAASRLADLEARHERGATDDPRLMSAALRELKSAIQDLHAAIEQLNELSSGIATARSETQQAIRRYGEFFAAMPVPTVLSDANGVMTFGNDAAADLLNVSVRHLTGRPLVLFVGERDRFLRMAADSGLTADPIGGELTIRPRDRKTRRVSVKVQHLPEHGQRCWFFATDPAVVSAA